MSSILPYFVLAPEIYFPPDLHKRMPGAEVREGESEGNSGKLSRTGGTNVISL